MFCSWVSGWNVQNKTYSRARNSIAEITNGVYSFSRSQKRELENETTNIQEAGRKLLVLAIGIRVVLKLLLPTTLLQAYRCDHVCWLDDLHL